MLIYDALIQAARNINLLVENGELPADDWRVEDARQALLNSAQELYAFDDRVRETVDARAKSRIGDITEQQAEDILELTEIIAPEASPRLGELLRDDALKIRDAVAAARLSTGEAIARATHTITDAVSDAVKESRDAIRSAANNVRDAAYRFGRRLVRMMSLDKARIDRLAKLSSIASLPVTIAAIVGWFLLLL